MKNKILRLLDVYKTDYTLKNYGVVKDKGGCCLEDGFYVVPSELLKVIEQSITIGVGTMVDFEEAVHKEYPTMSMSFYDGTIDSFPSTEIENAVFHKENLGQIDMNNSKSINTILFENDVKNKRTMLKIDCEGAEYLSLPYMSEELTENIDIFVLELHWLGEHYYDAIKLLEQLNKNFTLVHCHGVPWCGAIIMNGESIPNVVELTFINKNKDTNNLGNIFYRQGLDLVEYV